ncbi:kinase-like protein [Atractiella rhizophila]|nr:kinase-like protein [Atractiella rhizophila]
MYQPLEVIGNGTFGIIRKVRRVKDGMVLARKELNYARMDQKDLLQLSSEVNILQNLTSNSHIVKYYDRFVDKKNCMLFILMEYCEGGDLAALITRCKREKTLIPEDLVWSYLTQLTVALHDCHCTTDANGNPKEVILHRDIKPENVFLDKDNNLKLGDFGLSKAMSVAAFTNTYVGTPYYMSPELISGSDYGRSSDIWSLGCLIYELCAWHPPFHEAKTQVELAKLIKEGKIPDLPKGYSSTLAGVIRSMLRQNVSSFSLSVKGRGFGDSY